jgi:hypothetical protein
MADLNALGQERTKRHGFGCRQDRPDSAETAPAFVPNGGNLARRTRNFLQEGLDSQIA